MTEQQTTSRVLISLLTMWAIAFLAFVIGFVAGTGWVR
jgi:hypothetical protein